MSLATFRRLLESKLVGRLEAQKTIDPMPHYVPIDIGTLTTTLGKMIDTTKLSIPELQTKVIAFVSSSSHSTLVAKNGAIYSKHGRHNRITTKNIRMYSPALVEYNNKIVGLLYASKDSFKTLGKKLFTPFLNKEIAPYLLDSSTSKLHIGHTNIVTDSGDILGISPLIKQSRNIESTLERALLSTTRGFTDTQAEEILYVLSKVQNIEASLEMHSSFSTYITTTLEKDFQDSLLSVKANITIIQDGDENTKLWGILEASAQRELAAALQDIHFSRSLTEEITYRVVSGLKGLKVASTLKKTDIPKIIYPEKKTSIGKGIIGIEGIKKAPLRTDQGQFYSLTSLQTLINTHLQNVISANMGDEGYPGGQRRILNYRTGRFAASAQVERLSQSREGAITAFYSYQKNPYQVFEPGHPMGKPATRDPRLLISKSIREIAATKVGNRLRAVSI